MIYVNELQFHTLLVNLDNVLERLGTGMKHMKKQECAAKLLGWKNLNTFKARGLIAPNITENEIQGFYNSIAKDIEDNKVAGLIDYRGAKYLWDLEISGINDGDYNTVRLIPELVALGYDDFVIPDSPYYYCSQKELLVGIENKLGDEWKTDILSSLNNFHFFGEVDGVGWGINSSFLTAALNYNFAFTEHEILLIALNLKSVLKDQIGHKTIEMLKILLPKEVELMDYVEDGFNAIDASNPEDLVFTYGLYKHEPADVFSASSIEGLAKLRQDYWNRLNKNGLYALYEQNTFFLGINSKNGVGLYADDSDEPEEGAINRPPFDFTILINLLKGNPPLLTSMCLGINSRSPLNIVPSEEAAELFYSSQVSAISPEIQYVTITRSNHEVPYIIRNGKAEKIIFNEREMNFVPSIAFKKGDKRKFLLPEIFS